MEIRLLEQIPELGFAAPKGMEEGWLSKLAGKLDNFNTSLPSIEERNVRLSFITIAVYTYIDDQSQWSAYPGFLARVMRLRKIVLPRCRVSALPSTHRAKRARVMATLRRRWSDKKPITFIIGPHCTEDDDIHLSALHPTAEISAGT